MDVTNEQVRAAHARNPSPTVRRLFHYSNRIDFESLVRQICAQIEAYVHDADFQFSLPLEQIGTAHQMKVWQALCRIPRGHATTYGALAVQLNSSPRAIGQACGANPIPLIIPCHRVVAKNGAGGFMHHASGAPLAIKDWLLRHEGYAR